MIQLVINQHRKEFNQILNRNVMNLTKTKEDEMDKTIKIKVPKGMKVEVEIEEDEATDKKESKETGSTKQLLTEEK